MLSQSEDLKKPDYVIIIALSLLLAIGLVAVFSATQAANPAIKNNFSKQVIWILVGIVLMSIVVMMPMKVFFKYAYQLYFFSILSLILVFIVGGGNGVYRWFTIGPAKIQPSEIAKIATLLAIAKYTADDRRDFRRVKDVATSFLIILVPMMLIIKEPDLGTALVFLALILPVLFWAGVSLFTVFLLAAPLLTMISAFTFASFFIMMLVITGLMIVSRRRLRVIIPNFFLNIGVGIITPLLWSHMHGYQQSRILTFLGLQQDPRGLGYQVLQSKVAIGSGGFWGKGILQGTQTQLRFLPEQHTDFIFSVVGEEFGFIGVTLVLVTFLVLLWRSLNIAHQAKSKFSGTVAFGATIIIAFHVLVNSGMTVGVMPVTGIPLPFLSYGGSSLLTSMMLVALILNAGRRRFLYV